MGRGLRGSFVTFTKYDQLSALRLWLDPPSGRNRKLFFRPWLFSRPTLVDVNVLRIDNSVADIVQCTVLSAHWGLMRRGFALCSRIMAENHEIVQLTISWK